LSRAREELCDSRVLLRVPPADYARTLLGLGERLSGLSSASAISMFTRRHPLRSRIARLLDPRRDPAVRLGRTQRAALLTSALAAAIFPAGIDPPRAPATAQATVRQGPARPAPADREAADLIPTLASRSTDWLGPSPDLET